MDDLISRKAAYTTLTDYYHHTTEIQHKALREALERVPSAETHEKRTETHACDCISRQDAVEAIENIDWYHLMDGVMVRGANSKEHQAWYKEQDIYKALEQLPSAQPERAGRCVWCDGIEGRRLRIEFYWIDDDGNTASFSEPHIVATGIAKYCPECGRKLKMEVEHD